MFLGCTLGLIILLKLERVFFFLCRSVLAPPPHPTSALTETAKHYKSTRSWGESPSHQGEGGRCQSCDGGSRGGQAFHGVPGQGNAPLSLGNSPTQAVDSIWSGLGCYIILDFTNWFCWWCVCVHMQIQWYTHIKRVWEMCDSWFPAGHVGLWWRWWENRYVRLGWWRWWIIWKHR